MFSKRLKSGPVLKSKPLTVLVGGLVLLSMWSTSIAALFCPHMSGSSDCCLMLNSNRYSHESMNEMHMMHVQVAARDHTSMHDMGMSDMEATEVSDSETNDVKLINMLISSKRNADVNSQSITQPAGSCSHCMMHSQTRTAVVLSGGVQRNISHEFSAAEGSSDCITPSLSGFGFLDLHDHSPPRTSSPRYVLINFFRI